MRAALLHTVEAAAKLDLRDDVETSGVDPGEVKVRLRATGVCHSDLSVMTGVIPSGLPAVLGHEGAGEIVEVGAAVTGVAPGDHVVVNWTPACGTCAECLNGKPYLCLTFLIESFGKPRFSFGGTAAFGMAGTGTWAEEMVVPQQGVIKIDPDIPFEYAALLGCGIPTGVGAVINTAKVRPGESVAVIGCGGVGLSVIQGARISGAGTIMAVDPVPAKHEAALRLGATHTTTPDQAAEDNNAVTGGQGFDHVFEVVGRSATIRAAWDLTRRGGQTIVVGAGAADDMFSVSAFDLLFQGKSLLSSLYGGCDLRRDVGRFVNLWRAGRLDIEGLITRRITFAELPDAVEALRGADVIRQVVLFD